MVMSEPPKQQHSRDCSGAFLVRPLNDEVMMMVEMLLSQLDWQNRWGSIKVCWLQYFHIAAILVGLLTMSYLGFYFFVGLTEDRSTGIYKSRGVLYSYCVTRIVSSREFGFPTPHSNCSQVLACSWKVDRSLLPAGLSICKTRLPS